MTSATLHSTNVSGVEQTSVGDALYGVVTATHRLMLALLAAAIHRPKAVMLALTAFQEAEELRAMADNLLRTDRNFAQDLYSAADRHELSNRL